MTFAAVQKPVTASFATYPKQPNSRRANYGVSADTFFRCSFAKSGGCLLRHEAAGDIASPCHLPEHVDRAPPARTANTNSWESLPRPVSHQSFSFDLLTEEC